MTEPSLPALVIVADPLTAFTHLCGISLLERLGRIAQRLGFQKAMVLSNAVASVAAHLGTRSRQRADVAFRFGERKGRDVVIGDIVDCLSTMNVAHGDWTLVVFAGFYYDERLLRSLLRAQTNCVLTDSDRPPVTAPFWRQYDAQSLGGFPGAALISWEWLSGRDRTALLSQEIQAEALAGRMAYVDAAREPGYLQHMRRTIRPLFFPVFPPEHLPLAERLLLDTTQKGVLDFPALVHAPIEKWMASHLSRTSITPNQVTLVTALVGLGVTMLYASGHLWGGALLALAVGVLDGVDGKLARLKIHTTKLGKLEHVLDFCIEMSWWTALAYRFRVTGEIPYAYVILFLFFVFDVSERVGIALVAKKLGRNLDDVSPFDRIVRYVAGRRNIYTWLFTFCLLFGAPAIGFIWLCCWGMASAAIHIVRAFQILAPDGRKLGSPKENRLSH